LAYEFLAKLNHENTYVLYEAWENQSDFENYKTSPVFKEVGDILTPFLAGAPVNEYFVAEKIEL
jgi:quinol monooxygenase YgiN